MKEKDINTITIGLFGTCGGSNWRDRFMKYYDADGIEYFNPKVDNWQPENADLEAHHLKHDEIILFPVTDETYGLGSLAEVGFSILQAIKVNTHGFIVVLIDPTVKKELEEENPAMAKASKNTRALVLAHLKEQELANVFIVDSLEKMLEISEYLYEVVVKLKHVRTLCKNTNTGE